MNLAIPQPLPHECKGPHERPRQAAPADGRVGEAAKALARPVHPRFGQEGRIALPPLGLCAALAPGEGAAELADALVEDACTEQEATYPAAALVDHGVRQRLSPRASTVAARE